MKNSYSLHFISALVSIFSIIFLVLTLCLSGSVIAYTICIVAWVCTALISPILPLISKLKRNDLHLISGVYTFFEVLALIIGVANIHSIAVYFFNTPASKAFSSIACCIILYNYFFSSKCKSDDQSTPDVPAADSKIETPPVAPVVVEPVKEVPTEKIVLDAPRKPADKKMIAIVCLTCALIVSIGVIVYLGFFRPFAFYSSNGKYKKAVDIPIDCKDYMTDVEVNSYIYLDGSEKPIVYVKVILDDSISRLKPSERDSECNKTATYVIQCIDETLPESVVDTYCSNGRQYYYADIKIETSNEYIYHEEFRESMLKVKREG